MRAAKVQASLRIRADSQEPPLLTHTSSESRGTFRQKARSLAPLNGWACAVKSCHDGMLEDTNSLDAAQLNETCHEKTCLCHMRTTKGPDQPAHLRCLSSTFVVRCLDSTIPILAISKVLRLQVASVAEQASLSLT